jgi:hypothetical protein
MKSMNDPERSMADSNGLLKITREAAWFTLREYFRPLVILWRFAAKIVVLCYSKQRGISVFLHDGLGAPVTSVHLRLENGKIIEPDATGICFIPNGNSGKLVSVRDRATGREIKVVAIPEIVKPTAPLDILATQG